MSWNLERELDTLPKSPAEAVKAGQRYYVGERPCPKGHPPLRRVKSLKKRPAGNYATCCVECEKEYGRARDHKARDHAGNSQKRRKRDIDRISSSVGHLTISDLGKVANTPDLIAMLPKSLKTARSIGVPFYTRKGVLMIDVGRREGATVERFYRMKTWERDEAIRALELERFSKGGYRRLKPHTLSPLEILRREDLWSTLPEFPATLAATGGRYYMAREMCDKEHAPIRIHLNSGVVACLECHIERKTKETASEEARQKERASARAKRATDPEKYREIERAWRAANRAKVKAKKLRHKNTLTQATPKWLTEEQWDEMNRKYTERDEKTQRFGRAYQVDHIVPLHGDDVCGLHVPWNLRVIPASVNQRKSNKRDGVVETLFSRRTPLPPV